VVSLGRLLCDAVRRVGVCFNGPLLGTLDLLEMLDGVSNAGVIGEMPNGVQ
jgi:hypothetical protein